MMETWLYTITNTNGIVLTTTNTDFAEMKSKHGCKVFCKRKTKLYKFH